MKKVIVLCLFVMISIFMSCSSSATIYLKVAPTSHDFGAVNISETATFDFVLTNKKSVDMTLTIVSFSTGEFSDISAAQGKTIISKGTLTLTARFAPALPGGAKNDTIHIEWADINGKTGKKDIKLKGEAVPVPIINAPTTFDFGTVGLGSTDDHNFNIENTGSADLVLSLLNFNGNATLFSITAGGATPITIIPGATHTITVQFAPTTTGSFPTILEITHNAVNGVPPATIDISADGGGGRIEFNQTSPWDFGAVKNGGSTIDVVEISNTGSIDLNITSISTLTGTEFTVDNLEDSSGNPITTPFAISVGDYVEVTIKFSPTSVGNFNDSLSVDHDGSYSASPATISLVGTGRAPITHTFNYNGAVQNWNVPAGIGSIDVDAYGAEGGDAYLSASPYLPGKGGRVQATLTVTPGAAIGAYVGQKGQNAASSVVGRGGWNGGGSGSTGHQPYSGGGGGGASDIRSGGSALADRIVVAGAGGGAGYNGGGQTGGNGGGLTGQNANGAYGQGDGNGGTQTAGGAGGNFPGWGVGQTGTLGGGGNAASSGIGAGGGAGYYGGGGGCWAGGGGGSSFTAVGATGVVHTQGNRSGNGQIVVNY